MLLNNVGDCWGENDSNEIEWLELKPITISLNGTKWLLYRAPVESRRKHGNPGVFATWDVAGNVCTFWGRGST